MKLETFRNAISSKSYEDLTRFMSYVEQSEGRTVACAIYNIWASEHELSEGAMLETVRDMFTAGSGNGYGTDTAVQMTVRMKRINESYGTSLSDDFYVKVAKFLRTVKKTVQVDRNVIRIDRETQGHLCVECEFHRNTLLQYKGKKVVVSTVGKYRDFFDHSRYDTIGANRYYETMVFMADDNGYIKVDEEVPFDSDWAISKWNADNKAVVMHENVVAEITEKLKNGEI